MCVWDGPIRFLEWPLVKKKKKKKGGCAAMLEVRYVPKWFLWALFQMQMKNKTHVLVKQSTSPWVM